MADASVLNWLSTIPSTKRDCEHLERPAKRARLNRSDDRLPTPSVSADAQACLDDKTTMPPSPTKRRRSAQPGPDPGLDGTESTPQLQKLIIADANQEGSVSGRSYASSSKASKISRTSSPTKQLRHAELQETGFRQANFSTAQAPASLIALREELKETNDGWKILPGCLKEELQPAGIPRFFFNHDDTEPHTFRYPSLEQVRNILAQANDCYENGEGESSWNMEVHAPLLKFALREGPAASDTLDFRYCLNAALIPEYRPKDAPSKMVDFCLAIQPGQEDQQLIDQIRRIRPGASINHTDWGRLSKQPIAVSIETKRFGDQFDTAVLQIGTWHSSQWRSLRWGNKALANIDFLPAIIIQGHDWEFIGSALATDGVTTLFNPPLQIGNTRSEEGIYKLLICLQQLKRWAEESFWPAFKTDVLGFEPPANQSGAAADGDGL